MAQDRYGYVRTEAASKAAVALALSGRFLPNRQLMSSDELSLVHASTKIGLPRDLQVRQIFSAFVPRNTRQQALRSLNRAARLRDQEEILVAGGIAWRLSGVSG